MMHLCARTTPRSHRGGGTHDHSVTAVPTQAAGQRARQMLTAHGGATPACLPPAVCQTRGRGNRDIVWCPGGIPASACSCQPPASSPRCGAQQEADSRAAASAAGCGALPLQLPSPALCTRPWWLPGACHRPITPRCPCMWPGVGDELACGRPSKRCRWSHPPLPGEQHLGRVRRLCRCPGWAVGM